MATSGMLAVALLVMFGGGEERARPLIIVTFGDSTTAPRDVGDALSGRPAESTQGEVNSESESSPHNVVNIVRSPSPWLYVYSDILRTELPRHGIAVTVDNEGVGGNRTDEALSRLRKDVGSKKPDYVVVQFGINDSWWDEGQPSDLEKPDSSRSRVPLNAHAQSGGDDVVGDGKDHPFSARNNYCHNLRAIVDELQSLGAKVILLTPNQVSVPQGSEWRNTLLGQYADVVRVLAKDRNTFLVDVWNIFGDYARQPGCKIQELLLDEAHPNARGHRLVADALMRVIVESESE